MGCGGCGKRRRKATMTSYASKRMPVAKPQPKVRMERVNGKLVPRVINPEEETTPEGE